jgi:hypothetical protein
MKHARWLLTVLCVLMLLPLLSDGAEFQPHMKAALELLQSAKQADKPMPMLMAARKHLMAATKNKGGALGQAAQTLREAIALVETHAEKSKIEQKINATIANVQNGMGNAN